jgi:hypothetical protein
MSNGQETKIIDARCHWNDTGIKVQKGVRYKVTALIEEPIIDGDPPLDRKLCGLEGWDSPLFWPVFFLKRQPFERYFALIGFIDKKHPRRIVEYSPSDPYRTVYIAPATGQLWCYFNDGYFLYFNNHGKLKLRFDPCEPHSCPPN